MACAKLSRTVAAILIAVFMSACSTLDTPYDPDPRMGESLFDQIPNNDNAADRCAGHIAPSKRLPHQTGRC